MRKGDLILGIMLIYIFWKSPLEINNISYFGVRDLTPLVLLLVIGIYFIIKGLFPGPVFRAWNYFKGNKRRRRR